MEYMKEYTKGYSLSYLDLDDDNDEAADMAELEAKGYLSLGSCDLNAMFGAFQTSKKGVVGGDRTVDDYTVEGLEW